MSTFYTSDLHFGHANILAYEPSRRAYLGLGNDATVEDMNEALVGLWNAQVGPDDTVVVLGDVAMGKVKETIEYVRELNGTKMLILGNHDRPHPICTRSAEKQQEWLEIYEDVGFVTQTIGPLPATIDGVSVQMSHFPYEGDHTTTERYNADDITRFVPVDNGLPLVHGHVHSEWRTRGRMYNCGIDAWHGVFQTPEQIGAYFRTL